MSTAADLIEFLKQFPPDTLIECVSGSRGSYGGDSYYEVNFKVTPVLKGEVGEYQEGLPVYQSGHSWSFSPGFGGCTEYTRSDGTFSLAQPATPGTLLIGCAE